MKGPLFLQRTSASSALVLTGILSLFAPGPTGAASVDLWQSRNGPFSTPVSPIEWVKGNAGPANSHYIEGHSIPYRLVMSDLAMGPHQVVIEWDTRQRSKHALDFITHYDRLLPHDQFGPHTNAETINPLTGLSGPFGTPSSFPIPAPSTVGSPVPGQPAASFNALEADGRALTIWNASITGAAYVHEGNLLGESAVSRLAIDFAATNPTVVLSFGAHIASKFDWGASNSATSIDGSPYHMRIISLDGAGGNQDRSVQALAVRSPPTAGVEGPELVCANSTNTYRAITDATNGAGFHWSLSNNASAAFIVGATNESTVQVAAGSEASSYSVVLVVTEGMLIGNGERSSLVQTATTTTAFSDQTRCPGGTVTFETSAAGTGPFSFLWFKDGQPMANATSSALSLSGLQPSDSGAYCVEVTGTCGTATRCATLTVVTPPVVTCPPDVAVQCFADIPPPAPGAVIVTGGSDPGSVIHVGDAFQTNGTDVILTRTYTTTGLCPVTCQQVVAVRDTLAPVVACPANLVKLEDAPASGGTAVGFVVPTASDNCDPSPIVLCTPPAASRFAVGDTTVECVATDVAGNSSSCTFTIRVVPRTIIASSTADSGPGTLRQALLDANDAEGANVIEFAFPGGPPYVIRLLSPLPPIGDAVTIDGWSQLEFRGEPVIEIDGTNAVPPTPAGERAGLVLAAASTTVRGLVINGFVTGIRAGGAGGHVIQGNLVGLTPSGAATTSNSADGIVILSPNNLIGGPAAEARNVISRNGGHGIVLESPLATGNVIEGNFIGTGLDGITPAGNALAGVAIRDGASGNTIGPGNVIAHNGGNGVLVESTAGAGNAIRGNIITANGALGIDLGGDGFSGNDNGDPDAGPNDSQNSPTILTARTDGATTLIRGTLDSAPNRSYSIEIFARMATPSGLAAPTLLGTVTITTDAGGIGTFEASFAVYLPAGSQVFATATDTSNNTSEFSPAAQVGSPPLIFSQPTGTTAPPGGVAAFCVAASGTEPLLYQWRRNGANIPGATNECYVISNVELADGGTYTVVIANELGAVASDPAILVLDLPRLAAGDNFADRVPLVGPAGIASGTNLFATRELGEPIHAGKPGGSSVWYTWTAPDTGIATFRTTGSTFDTLLGIYTGLAVGALTTAASDEDLGGFYTSGTRFNTTGGATYHIAIDGFGGTSGDFVLAWSLEVTGDSLPVITNQPISQTVAPGGSVTFVVGAMGNCRAVDHDCRTADDGKPQRPDPKLALSYQWYFNGAPIVGATSATLSLTNVQDSAVGIYTVQVSNGARTLFAQPAVLQINLTEVMVQNVQATDKFLDAAISAPLRLGAVLSGASQGIQPASVVRGYTGTQVFNTAGSATETGEGPICGPVVGGASQWFSFIAEDTGTIFFNTDGSSYDTVIAVYTRSTNGTLLQLACDNNGGLDGRDSALTVPVTLGRTNFLLLDGVNGATGTLRLNYSLVTPSFLTPLGKTAQGANRVRVTGRPGVKFTLQASANISSWSSLITTNAPTGTFDYVDTRSTNSNPRYYRALLLP